MQGIAFVLSVVVMFFLKNGNFGEIKNVNRFYLLGGALGIVITITVMLGVKNLSPAVAISTILISQLIVAAVIDAFGLMESKKIAFTLNKYLGIILMIGGMLLFKWNVTKG